MIDYKAEYEALVTIINSDEGQSIYPCGHLTEEDRQAFKGADAYKCGWNDAIIDDATMSKKILARAKDLNDDLLLLLTSGECFYNAESQTISINMNDTWAWALSWIPEVPHEEVKEVARLFRTYGRAGLMYWHSCHEKNMRSEFEDNNRMIDFVRNEERIRQEVPDHNNRAFHKATYTIGDKASSSEPTAQPIAGQWVRFWLRVANLFDSKGR